jgi:hypothetical protein
MIELYSGTMGSGKSLHMARDIKFALVSRKKNVIANFPIDMELVTNKGKRKTGEFIYLDNEEMTVEYLVKYAMKHHTVGKEGQTLLIIDEAGIKFNSRFYNEPDRPKWIKFFIMSRKLGFNILMASQKDRLIDRQIRSFIEYDVRHRKANNFRLIGLILSLFRIPLFVAVKMWYGMNEKCHAEIFMYRKKDGALYDTMMIFDEDFYGKCIGDTVDISADEEYKNDTDEPTAAAPVADGEEPRKREGHPSRPGRLSQGTKKRYICYTTECDVCKAHDICKMVWKYLPAAGRA